MRLRDRVLAHPYVAPLKPSWQRGRVLERPLPFVLREAAQRGAGAYRLRADPAVAVAVRHGTPDAETLDQVFLQRALEPPPAAAARLDGLGRPPVVVDLGANIGASAAWWSLRFPGARVTCVEADPHNVAVLRRANAAGGGRWSIVAAAAAAAAGTLTFAVGQVAVSRVTEGAGTAVPAIDTFELLAERAPDLLKVDIEGGEWPLLLDARWLALRVPVIALEYHTHQAPDGDPRQLVLDRLAAAGYAVEEVEHVRGAPAGEGSLWARHLG